MMVTAKRIKIFFLVSWGLAVLYVLLAGIADSENFQNSEILQFYYIAITLLTAPSGYLLAVVGGLVWESMNWLREPLYQFVASWVLMVIGGYLQWFVFLPFVVRKARGLFHRSVGSILDKQ